MRISTLVILAFATTGASSCKSTECGTGTIERDGTCQPADETTGTAKCGPFTVLQGEECVPMYPPTICDPGTTSENTDTPEMGVSTCVGTGMSAGCNGTFNCPTPAAGTQTICGQIYNFADNSKFAAAGATGAKCTQTTTSGPCALQVVALDAAQFAGDYMHPMPLQVGEAYIDDCGRYRVSDIVQPAGPFIALGFDDAGQPFGPTGVTVTTGVALPKQADSKTSGFEAWIVDPATVGMWQSTGGPMLANGIYSAIFRQHMCDAGVCTGDGFANQAGATFTKGGMAYPAQDYYFTDTAGRTTIDMNGSASSSNGTALFTGASVGDSYAYSGTGGITDTTNCQWDPHVAASVPGVVFMQVYRKGSKVTKTCTE